jgi:hypothetical protein
MIALRVADLRNSGVPDRSTLRVKNPFGGITVRNPPLISNLTRAAAKTPRSLFRLSVLSFVALCFDPPPENPVHPDHPCQLPAPLLCARRVLVVKLPRTGVRMPVCHSAFSVQPSAFCPPPRPRRTLRLSSPSPLPPIHLLPTRNRQHRLKIRPRNRRRNPFHMPIRKQRMKPAAPFGASRVAQHYNDIKMETIA